MDQKTHRRGIAVVLLLFVALVGLGLTVCTLTPAGQAKADALSDSDRLSQARSAYSEHDSPRALRLLEPVVRDGHGELSVRLFYGQVLLDLGRLTQCRDLCNSLHKDHPNETEVVLALGELHERSGEMDLAVTCYRRASEMNKDSARAFRLLGLAQYRRGDSMAAMFAIRQSLRLLPGQEDLSRLLNDIGGARQARAGAPNPFRGPEDMDPFENRRTTPPDPWDTIPHPQAHDPFDGIPNPGQRMR